MSLDTALLILGGVALVVVVVVAVAVGFGLWIADPREPWDEL